MNRITRCPLCTTVYQLGEAHLQAAKGWLRCGACGHVFDSTGLVLRWTPATAEAPLSSLSAGLDAQETPDTQLTSVVDAAADPTERIALDDLLQKEDRSSPDDSQPAQSKLVGSEQVLPDLNSDPLMVDTQQPRELETEPKSSIRWLATYGVVGLTLLLFLQLAYVQRDAIVASWPESEPVIRHVCQSFGCQVSPLREAEGVVIDSSGLVKRSEDHILTWSVRNTTSRVLGMTALELSLMDGQGKLVMRTVMLPEQTGAPQVLASGQSWSGSLRVTLAQELNFSDYRLLSFYP
jgi:predicted Zn finger-like uncharacterized protein